MAEISSRTISLYYIDSLEKEFSLKEIGYDNFNSDYIVPYKIMRMQKFNTFHIVLSGKGYLDFTDKSYNVKTGDIFFIPPEATFRYYPDDNDKWEYVWFACEGELSGAYAKKMGFTEEKAVVNCNDFRNIYLMIKNFLLKNIPSRTSEYYDALSLFYKIIDLNMKRDDKKEYSYTEAIKSYVETYYYKTEMTVEEICEYFNISHSYMCRVFKRDMDISVKEYIIEVRIAMACDLLKKTKLRIQEIAFSVGFSDEIHFMKTFKKSIGITPKQYRIANN